MSVGPAGEQREMNRIQLQRIRASAAWFEPCGPAMIARVMRNLSDRRPGVRALFPDDSARLNKRSFETLMQVVENLHRFQRLEAPLMELGARARQAGLTAAHYRVIRDELLLTMAELADVD